MNFRAALLNFVLFGLSISLIAQETKPPPAVDPELLKPYEFELELERKLTTELADITQELQDDDESVKAAGSKLGAAIQRHREALGKRRPLREPSPEIAEILKAKRGDIDQHAAAILRKLSESRRYAPLIVELRKNTVREVDPPIGVPAGNGFKIEAIYADPAAKPLVLPADLIGHQDDVTALAFSGDGKWLATAAGGENEPNGRSIRVWNLQTGLVAYLLSLPPTTDSWSHIHNLRLTHDGSTLLSCTKDGYVQIWDLKNRRPGVTFDMGFSGGALRLDVLPLIALSGDGKTAAVSDVDEVIVFDLATGALNDSRNISPPTAVASLALSSDGKLLARGVVDLRQESLEVWHVGTKKVLKTAGPKQIFLGMKFTADDKRLLMVNLESSEASYLDVQTGVTGGPFPVEKSADPVFAALGGRTLDLSADGKFLLVQTGFDLAVYDAVAGKKIRMFRNGLTGPTFHRLAFSPDGKLIARGSNKGLVRLMTADKGLDDAVPVEIGDYPPNPEKLILRGHTDYVMSLDYSPDGKRLVSASRDQTVRVWNTATGALEKTFDINSSCVRTLRDGKTAMVYVVDKEFSATTKIALLNLATGQLSASFGAGRKEAPLEDKLRAIAQLPDGRFVGTSQEGLSFWKVDGTFEKLIALDPKLCGSEYDTDPKPLLVSRDGKRIFTDDVLLWDVPNAKKLLHTAKFYLRSEGHTRCVALSPDGKLAAGHEFRKGQPWKLRLWNTETGQSVLEQEFDGFLTPQTLTFSANGKVLVFGSIGPGHTFVDVATGETLGYLKSDSVLHEALFSPDGKQLAETAQKNIVLRSTSAFPAAVRKVLAEPSSSPK